MNNFKTVLAATSSISLQCCFPLEQELENELGMPPGDQVIAFQRRTFETPEHCCLHILKLLNSSEDSGFSNQTLHLDVLFEAGQDHPIQGEEQGVFHYSTDPTGGKMEVLVGSQENKKAGWGTAAAAAEDKDWVG